MSFYDLTKEGILRPTQIFKYRLKRDSSIPSRGGQKDFEPDGSWLQSKRLETFVQERKSIISEPRVEKLKNLVEGLWDEEKRLVSLKKPGKFWMHMGFTDERRNWLYPEEALFLMETNTLELYHHEKPMSIQEAYCKVLGPSMCLEEYQVFAHLRRLGYVVLRHEEERLFTEYERKINLNEYIDKRKRKERMKKGKGKSNKKINHNDTNISKDLPTSVDDLKTEEQCKNDLNNVDSADPATDCINNVALNGTEEELTNSPVLCSKRNLENELDSEETCSKAAKLNNGLSKLNDLSCVKDDDTDSPFYNLTSWASCFGRKIQNPSKMDKESVEKSDGNKNCNPTVVGNSLFPDMAQQNTKDMKLPPSHLLPSNMDITELEWGFSEETLKKNPSLHKAFRAPQRFFRKEDYTEKTFSCLEKMKKEPKIKAGSWSEYKRKKAERQAQMSASSLVQHLWNDTVTPLMSPTEITSYGDIMNRLQIIQTADNDSIVPDASGLPTLPKVSFDVHLPDHRFKKSMPGIPDHRVCVTRSDGVPPGLTAIQYLWNKYKDGVPVHWAVVDSGEIAFYAFDNTRSLEVLSL